METIGLDMEEENKKSSKLKINVSKFFTKIEL